MRIFTDKNFHEFLIIVVTKHTKFVKVSPAVCHYVLDCVVIYCMSSHDLQGLRERDHQVQQLREECKEVQMAKTMNSITASDMSREIDRLRKVC